MVIVSMTSWVKRIKYVKSVAESIMNNTVQPDRLYLNLSRKEFEGIELPQDLIDYFKSDERLVINWVEGENTKSMKKIFPILQYLNDDDIIIDADDDILFPNDLIESRLKDFKDSGCKYCISSNTSNSINFNRKMKVVSAMSLFQKKMFNHWEEFLTKEIYDTNNDDRTYLTLMWLNGYLNKSCSKYSIKDLLKSNYNLNLDDALSKNSQIRIGRFYDNISSNVVYKITRKTIIDSFEFWK